MGTVYLTTILMKRESNKPSDPTENDTHKGQPTTSVKGQYNPATSIGGANTGDTSDLMLYVGICCITLGINLYLMYKRKADFQYHINKTEAENCFGFFMLNET